MNITIAGIGNAGTTVGADLSRKGHKVTLLKTSKIMHNEHYEYYIQCEKILIDNNYNFVSYNFSITCTIL